MEYRAVRAVQYLCAFMADSTSILCIDTSLDVCSVAVQAAGSEDIIYLEEKGYNIHSEKLTVMIQSAIKKAGMKLNDLDSIAISKGPGSYTGLRIGVSSAKGLCYSLDKPLIAVNTLQAMVPGAVQAVSEYAGDIKIFCPMIDARRMEVYYALFDKDAGFLKDTKAEVVNANFLKDELSNGKIVFFGNGMNKCREILDSSDNAIFLMDIYPKASDLIPFAKSKFEAGDFEDLFSFEPFYLKDFHFNQQKPVNSQQSTVNSNVKIYP